ncbi:MAG TPA: hypothetical protein VFO19_18930 [Vicinamibacterales bacterium]|nr:hypothetical protein [Vicinamibacterales bacterium]
MKHASLVVAIVLMAGSLNATSRDAAPRAAGARLSAAPNAGAAAIGSAHTLSGGEPRTAAFAAVGLPDGSVSGEAQINVHALNVAWHTRIECLTVVGNRAFMGGTITESTNEAVVRTGTKSYFWVEDNGEEGGAAPDRISVAGVNETPEGLADFCGLVQNLLPGRDVVHGNVQVR